MMSETKANEAKNCGEFRAVLIYVVDDEPMLLELAAVILEPPGLQPSDLSRPGNGDRNV